MADNVLQPEIHLSLIEIDDDYRPKTPESTSINIYTPKNNSKRRPRFGQYVQTTTTTQSHPQSLFDVYVQECVSWFETSWNSFGFSTPWSKKKKERKYKKTIQTEL